MREIPKTELSPDNGAVIDTKWQVGPLRYYACAASEGNEAEIVSVAPRMPRSSSMTTLVSAARMRARTSAFSTWAISGTIASARSSS
jgi:hypothetical protein